MRIPWRYCLILYYIFLFSTAVLPQKRTVYDYYPQHVGDVWEYVTYEGASRKRDKYFISKIDTVHADTAIYVYWGNDSTPSVKIRLDDSSTVYLYTSWSKWIPILKFNAPFKSYWNAGGSTYYYLDTLMQVNYMGYNTEGLRIYTCLTEPIDGPRSRVETCWYLKGIGLYSSAYDFSVTVLRGCIINGVNYGYPVSIEEEKKRPVTKNSLKNYPNPFNSETRIVYELSSASDISVRVFDVVGREVAVIEEGYKEAGSYTRYWNPRNIASGTYIIVFRSNNSFLTRKMIYLK
jgi:hypothetical protein